MLNKKKIIIYLIVISMAAMVGLFGYYLYNSYQVKIDTQWMEQHLSEIENEWENFNNSQTREDKLSIYKKLSSLHDFSYRNSEKQVKVEEKWTETIQNMRSYFVHYYSQIFEQNKIQELEKVNDKEKIYAAKAALDSLWETIEQDDILDESETSEWYTMITETTKNYTDQIAAIEKAEEEARKAEEEARKAEEEKKAAEAQKASASYSNATNGNSSYSSGNSNSGSSGSGWQYNGWITGDDGEKHYYTVDEDGTFTGEDGEQYNINDWR